MTLPRLSGVIDRRILINYRIDPQAVKELLPPAVNPLVINGYASGGICLLRLKNIGLKYTPSFLRINSENAAHRFLVSWEKDGRLIKGVYIPRRDTDSTLNVLLAGKVFSWPHYAATFEVREHDDQFRIKMKSADGDSRLHIEARRTNNFPAQSMFNSLEHASQCFESCAIGLSPGLQNGNLKSIRLKTKSWSVMPLEIQQLSTSYFDNESNFPKGSIAFDHALLMEGVEHEWVAGEE